MKVTVQFYGGLKQRAGADSVAVTVGGDRPTVGAVVEALQKQIGALDGVLGPVARAVGDEIVDDAYELSAGQHVALLPPVSGGSPGRWLSPNDLDRQALIAETADPGCGALVVFSGDVRDHNAGRTDVVAIDYEAHGPIASRVLATIEEEVTNGFDVSRCRIQHRTGRVEVGQSSVLVVCRAAHRDAAFRGARYAIDELKERTPIWKKEFYADGTSGYLDGTPLRTGTAIPSGTSLDPDPAPTSDS